MGVDTGAQTAQLIDGTRKFGNFDTGEMLKAGGIGAAFGAAFGLVAAISPELAFGAGVGFGVKGVQQGIGELGKGHTATGIFDIVTSIGT